MSTIDQRVVRMEFQNEQFESGIKSSIKSLDNLKNSLNLEGASRGLSELGSASKGFSLASIGESVDAISEKFTTLGIIGVTALQNITNKAIDAGIQMAKSLTVDQITSGWTKYEQKTASVQTLMNSTGKSVEEINGYLDKLMWFSDETSYGFTDMTQALAQMTITGGDIEKLVPMLMGVANATAFAGKGAKEFSHIIYNLAQSYGTGALKLIDWKSVELMGGASVQLKQAIIDAGEALGTIKKGDVTISNFTDNLTKGEWATQEVLEMAFGSFAEMTEKAYEMVKAGDVDTASEAYEILAQTYDNVAMKAARSAQEAKTFASS